MAGREHPGAGHRARLREKFLRFGLEKFTDEEVLELLLTLATPRRDCKQQARALMQGLGSLRAVLEAEPGVLARYPGIGPRNILGLKLVPAVARRYLEERLLHMGRFHDAAQAAEYLEMTMRSLQREIFRVILLDGEHRVRSIEDLARGSLDRAPVHPREVVACALAAGAAAVVCAHNHPGGKALPSRADRRLTRHLYHACRAVEIDLVDHIIVGQEEMYSFAGQGVIAALAREYQTLDL